MRVRDLMTTDPVTCEPGDRLSTAMRRMRDRDCGILPVTDDGKILGVVTDRDIALALVDKASKAPSLTIADLLPASAPLHCCAPEQNVQEALETMRAAQVRRLPVVEDGHLRGILSLNDVALAAHPLSEPQGAPTYSEVVWAIQGICAHGVPVEV